MAGRRAPRFWARDASVPLVLRVVLAPASWAVGLASARRARRTGWDPGVPVLCVGNVSVGGSGKTTVVLDLAARLRVRGVAVHILLRGYGGKVRGPHRVTSIDTAAEVGDEALLLAKVAPVWVGADRAASARSAVAAGAQALLMDDGLQNPGLRKHASLLVVDAAAGFGNGRLLPLGPLREPVAQAAQRCVALLLIGDGADTQAARIDLPVLAARLQQDAADVAALRGKRLYAVAGIGRPEKFFGGLRAAGLDLAGTQALGDHQPYTPALRASLRDAAARHGATLVTTPKDAVRWGADETPHVVGVGIVWEDADAVEQVLGRWIGAR